MRAGVVFLSPLFAFGFAFRILLYTSCVLWDAFWPPFLYICSLLFTYQKKKKKKKINMTISDVPYHILLIMIIIYFCDF